jgi:hypothetical protein
MPFAAELSPLTPTELDTDMHTAQLQREQPEVFANLVDLSRRGTACLAF